jgi:hypothetical protein
MALAYGVNLDASKLQIEYQFSLSVFIVFRMRTLLMWYVLL